MNAQLPVIAHDLLEQAAFELAVQTCDQWDVWVIVNERDIPLRRDNDSVWAFVSQGAAENYRDLMRFKDAKLLRIKRFREVPQCHA